MPIDPSTRATQLGLDLDRIEDLLAAGEYVAGFNVVAERGTKLRGDSWGLGETWRAEVEVGTTGPGINYGTVSAEGDSKPEAIDALYRMLGARIG